MTTQLVPWLIILIAVCIVLAMMPRSPTKPQSVADKILAKPFYWCFEFDTRSVSGAMGQSTAWGFGLTRERALAAIHRQCIPLRGKIVKLKTCQPERPNVRYRIHGEHDYRNPTLAFIAGSSPIVDHDNSTVATMEVNVSDVQNAANWPMLRSTFQRGAVRILVRTTEGRIPLQEFLT